MRVHITGVSGAGSSTLAAALARQQGWRSLDGDDYFWLRPEPPFDARREPQERLALLLSDMKCAGDVVLAGSIDGWGLELEDAFDLIVFLRLDTDIRIQRLRAREIQRFGAVDADFLAWAAQYDTGTLEGRSLSRQRDWLSARSCPVLVIEGDLSVEERMRRVLDGLKIIGPRSQKDSPP